MAPKAKSTAEPMKQKSLMSFFQKDSGATPNPKAKATKPPATPASDASISSQELRTPEPRTVDPRTSNFSVGSLASSGGKSTPPTSEADIEMVSSDDDEHPVKAVRSPAVYIRLD